MQELPPSNRVTIPTGSENLNARQKSTPVPMGSDIGEDDDDKNGVDEMEDEETENEDEESY